MIFHQAIGHGEKDGTQVTFKSLKEKNMIAGFAEEWDAVHTAKDQVVVMICVEGSFIF
jgi:hypothetical protein